MTNLKEKLEIMQWLYERGVKPGMWANCDGGCLILSNEAEAADLYNTKPWHSLEQVLELLPRELPMITPTYGGKNLKVIYGLCLEEGVLKYKVLKKYFAPRPEETLKEHMRREQYSSLDSKHIEEGWSESNEDYHLAALKLLKRVMEEYPDTVSSTASEEVENGRLV